MLDESRLGALHEARPDDITFFYPCSVRRHFYDPWSQLQHPLSKEDIALPARSPS